MGSDPKQKKLMFFKIREIYEDDNIYEITVSITISDVQDENHVPIGEVTSLISR